MVLVFSQQSHYVLFTPLLLFSKLIIKEQNTYKMHMAYELYYETSDNIGTHGL